MAWKEEGIDNGEKEDKAQVVERLLGRYDLELKRGLSPYYCLSGRPGLRDIKWYFGAYYRLVPSKDE